MAYEGSKKNTDDKGNALIPCLVCFKENSERSGTDSPGNNRYFHQLAAHLKASHNMDVGTYQATFAGAEIMSETTKKNLAAARAKSPLIAAKAPSAEPKKGEVLHFGVATMNVLECLSTLDQKMVPPHDEDYELDDAKLEVLALGIVQKDNVMCVGPTGSGKTSLVQVLAAIANHPCSRINMNGDIRAADFIGEKLVEVDAESGQAVVRWSDGILPRAMRMGWWLLIDEIDACPPAIAFVLQAVLEGKPLVLSSNGGEIVEPHERFRIVATANTIGKGDDTGMYTGTNVMNEAFLDRFGTVMQFDYPKREMEIKILVAKAKIDEATAMKMVDVATKIRDAGKKEECYCSFSTRRLLKWAAKTVALRGEGKTGKHWVAAEVTVFNKLSKDDRKLVEETVQRILGR